MPDMNVIKKIISLTVAMAVGLLTWPAATYPARVYIDINSPYLRKIPTAVPIFKDANVGPVDTDLAGQLSGLLAETIEFTGFFKILDRAGFLENPQEARLMEHTVNFKNWTDIGAELLVTGGFRRDGSLLELELRLFDTFGGRMIVGKRYKGQFDDQRRMIRRFSDEIILKLTGHAGIFSSRIAFVSTTTGNKEIYIADFDGRDPEQFTNTTTITLFPAWSSDGGWLAYTDYRQGKPQLYIRNINEKRSTVVNLPGSSITPAWVPGRLALAASLSHEGNPVIYLLNVDGKIEKKLTHHWSIDVSPTWSPDGKEFAFVSDRSGSPQIYIKNVEEDTIRRITYQGKYNTSPQWSPRGSYLAYAGLNNGRVNIYLIAVDGTTPVQLTTGSGNNESPTWSPDGTLIAFSSTREGPSRIYVMNANGDNQRRLLILGGEQTNPSWSPCVTGD